MPQEQTTPKIELHPDPNYVSPEWKRDATGEGWGGFYGNIKSQCFICGAMIVSGWRSEDGSKHMCSEHAINV